jgi:tetratricopeptide (TPR) repeat protein
MVAVPVLLALLLVPSSAESSSTPRNFTQIAQQADAARQADRMQEAIDLYSSAVRLRPSWRDGWWWLGSLLYDQDRFPEAQAALERFVAISANPAPAYAFLGLCQYETRDYAQALTSFQKWARMGSPGTDQLIDVAGFHWALLLTREGHFVEALYLLAAKAQKLGPNPALTEAMGLASLRMASLPEDYPPERREMVWLAGEAAVRATLEPHQFDRADDRANRLLAHYGREPNVHYFRGTLLVFEDKRREAEQEFLKELEIAPKNAAAMVELARIRLPDDPTGAMSYARNAVEIEPSNAEAHHMVGRVLLRNQQYADSAKELESAKRLAPDSASIRYQLAQAYRKLGRKQDAERETAAFNLLKDKQEVLAPPEEKLRPADKSAGTRK